MSTGLHLVHKRTVPLHRWAAAGLQTLCALTPRNEHAQCWGNQLPWQPLTWLAAHAVRGWGNSPLQGNAQSRPAESRLALRCQHQLCYILREVLRGKCLTGFRGAVRRGGVQVA
eukprot:364536-Chlamydomonas_euryale.AAC.10